MADRGCPFDVIHSDDFRRRTYEQMYHQVSDAIEGPVASSQRHWVLDGTFYEREWRAQFYQLGETYEVWVRASLETCLERNRERDTPIPDAGVRDIYNQFEPPRADLEIDTETLDVEESLDRFESVVLEWLTK